MWVCRGRKGVLDWIKHDEQNTKETTLEDKCEGPFAAERVARKMAAIHAGQKQFDTQQEQMSNHMPSEGVLDAQAMLAMLTAAGVNHAAPASSGSAAADSSQTTPNKVGPQGDDDSEDG